MDNNKMREQFEAWYVKKFHGGLRDQSTERWLSRDEVSDGYIYRDPQENWEAWKASREAVVMELPKFDDYPASMERDMRESLRAAIESQGLKVAP